MPVFVLTHHPRPPVECRGGTTFTFVTAGPPVALDLAREAARGRGIAVAGGAGLGLEQVRVIEAPAVTHLTYRRVG